jgi:hypothetical protein
VCAYCSPLALKVDLEIERYPEPPFVWFLSSPLSPPGRTGASSTHRIPCGAAMGASVSAPETTSKWQVQLQHRLLHGGGVPKVEGRLKR